MAVVPVVPVVVVSATGVVVEPLPDTFAAILFSPIKRPLEIIIEERINATGIKNGCKFIVITSGSLAFGILLSTLSGVMSDISSSL